MQILLRNAVKISSRHYETRFRKEPLAACRAVHYLLTFPTTVRFLARRARSPASGYRAITCAPPPRRSRSRFGQHISALIRPIRRPFFCSQFSSVCLPGDDPLNLRMKTVARERSFHLNLNVANYVRVGNGRRRRREPVLEIVSAYAYMRSRAISISPLIIRDERFVARRKYIICR